MIQIPRFMRAMVAALAIAVGPAAVHATVVDVGPQTGQFGPSNVRGFWFVAPTDFTVVGLGVPTDASRGNFDVALMRFNGTPPDFSASTNDFTTLHLSRNVAGTDLVDVDIDIQAGDIIGVLGSRDGITSYGAQPYQTSFLGFSATLNRLGMQNPLRTVDPRDIWGEPSSVNFGRVLIDIQSTRQDVPEPGTLVLVAFSILGLVSVSRRQRPATGLR